MEEETLIIVLQEGKEMTIYQDLGSVLEIPVLNTLFAMIAITAKEVVCLSSTHTCYLNIHV